MCNGCPKLNPGLASCHHTRLCSVDWASTGHRCVSGNLVQPAFQLYQYDSASRPRFGNKTPSDRRSSYSCRRLLQILTPSQGLGFLVFGTGILPTGLFSCSYSPRNAEDRYQVDLCAGFTPGPENQGGLEVSVLSNVKESGPACDPAKAGSLCAWRWKGFC
jgi:hypothetical protein